jgi:hypothetical protein
MSTVVLRERVEVARFAPELTLEQNAAVRSAHAPMLVSMATLEVVGGYLQCVADLASDRRYLLFYTRSGVQASQLAIDVPLGLLAATADGNVVVFVRPHESGRELAFYEATVFYGGASH